MRRDISNSKMMADLSSMKRLTMRLKTQSDGKLTTNLNLDPKFEVKKTPNFIIKNRKIMGKHFDDKNG